MPRQLSVDESASIVNAAQDAYKPLDIAEIRSRPRRALFDAISEQHITERLRAATGNTLAVLWHTECSHTTDTRGIQDARGFRTLGDDAQLVAWEAFAIHRPVA